MRLDDRIKKYTAIFIGAVGLLSSIVTTLTASFNKNSVLLGVILLLVTALIVFIILYLIPKESLPSGIETVADAINNNNTSKNIKIIFPCDIGYYRAVNKLAKEKFGKNSASTSAANDWQKKNEYILTCLTDNNLLVGYFDILPLKPDFAQRFISGEVGEKDIRAEHLFSFHELKKAEYVYFAGIAVKNTNVGAGCIHATYLIYAAILYLKTFYSGSNLKQILTIPTSDEGLAITKKFFSLEREGGLRKDGQDLYSSPFNLLEFTQLISEKKDIYKRFDASAYRTLLKEFH